MPRFPVLSSVTILAGLLALPRAARADHPAPMTITGTSTTLSGEVTYDSLTVTAGAILHVSPYVASDAGSNTTGWLRVKANVITVDKGGSIVADGAGYPGVTAMDGLADPSGSGAGKLGLMMGLPGGGGAYGANGADGAVENAGACASAGATGGMAFFMKPTLALGSAGGAANTSGPIPAVGAAGGGMIELMAGKIVIDGTVSANGADANEANGIGSGGGSGGSIHILAGILTTTTSSGLLSADGGKGAHGGGIPAMNIKANDGGGGSGGVILLSLPMPATAPSGITTSVTGGTTGTCAGMNGTDGQVVPDPLPNGATCIDVDGDGSLAASCGGGDCDDVDPAIHPGAKEICDGLDNNCNMQIDEGKDICGAGEVCIKGACELADAGTDSGPPSDGGTLPDHLDFGGGIGAGCGVPPGMPAEGAAALALAVGTLMLAASRRRPPRK
jgi:hypothetical protein